MNKKSHIYKDPNRNIGIRPFTKQDTEPFYEMVRESIEHVSPFLPWCHPDYSMSNARSWVNSRAPAWRAGNECSFLIFQLDTEQLLGSVEINRLHDEAGVGNLGYWIRRSALGKGLAVSASRLVADFGFGELRLRQLEIRVLVENRASQSVAEKLGAEFLGELVGGIEVGGEIRAGYCYSLRQLNLAE